MILFITAVFTFLICSLFPLKKQYFLLPLSFVFLLIFSAFRSLGVGTDTYNYLGYYNRIYSGEEWVRKIVEPGWVAINDIAIYFFNDFRAVLIIATLATLLPLYYVLYKYSRNPMFSLFIYLTNFFYLASLNITRQMLSASIVLIAVMMLIKNRKFWFISLVLLSSLFHASSLFFLVLIFVNRLPNKDVILITLSLGSVLVGIFGIELLIKVISLTPFKSYITYYEFGNKLGNLSYLILLNIFAIFIMFTTKIRDNYFKVFWFTLILNCLLVRIPFGDRIILSINLFYIVFYPYYISKAYIGNRNYKIIATIVIFILCLYRFSNNILYGEIFPYTNTLF